METKASISILIVMVLIIGTGIVMANENFLETKKLIDSGISCNNLTNEQLEEMGDYYMEQMHPSEAHELMHDMMGGHDSELTKNMHVNMAKSIYCKENVSMMNMMGGMMGNNMMSGGMMGSGMMAGGGMMGRGMMSNYYQNSYQNNLGFQIFFYIILTLVILVLILVIILLINKTKQKRR